MCGDDDGVSDSVELPLFEHIMRENEDEEEGRNGKNRLLRS